MSKVRKRKPLKRKGIKAVEETEISETVKRKPLKKRKKIVAERKLKFDKSNDRPGLMNKAEADYKLLEFHELKEQKKELEKREKQLRDELSAYIEAVQEPDVKDGRIMRVKNGKEEAVLHRRVDKKFTLNEEEALEYLIENGHDGLYEEVEAISGDVTEEQILDVIIEEAPEYIVHKKVINNELLEQAVMNGEIPMDDFEKLFNVSERVVMIFLKPEDVEAYEKGN